MTQFAKVRNLPSPRTGEPVRNQFVITQDDGVEVFQSYNTVIAARNGTHTTIDINALDYSVTTSKYLYQFLGLNRKEIIAAVKAGDIQEQDLNG